MLTIRIGARLLLNEQICCLCKFGTKSCFRYLTFFHHRCRCCRCKSMPNVLGSSERLALSKMECLRATDMGQSCSLCFNRKPTARTGGHIHSCSEGHMLHVERFTKSMTNLFSSYQARTMESCWYWSSLIKIHIYIKKVNNFITWR
jgi:hypothetical protein